MTRAAQPHFRAAQPWLSCAVARFSDLFRTKASPDQQPEPHPTAPVGGEVLGLQANQQTAPQAGADGHEHVPVLDNLGLVKASDGQGEGLWQGGGGDSPGDLVSTEKAAGIRHSDVNSVISPFAFMHQVAALSLASWPYTALR